MRLVHYRLNVYFVSWIGTSEGEDSSCEDSKPGVEIEGGKNTITDRKATTKHGHQPVFGE